MQVCIHIVEKTGADIDPELEIALSHHAIRAGYLPVIPIGIAGLAFVAISSQQLGAPDRVIVSKPPMSWNSWNHFRATIDDAMVRRQADAMVSSGMKAAGYVYINIDDTGRGQRDARGFIHPNSKFPDKKALADYVHSKGLKLDIYSSPGAKIWARPLADVSKVVGIFNRDPGPLSATVDFHEPGYPGPVRARDLWQQKDPGSIRGSYNAVIPAHGVIFLRVH